jgi:hypothetical protein
VQQPRAEDASVPAGTATPADDVGRERAPGDHPGRREQPQRLVDDGARCGAAPGRRPTPARGPPRTGVELRVQVALHRRVAGEQVQRPGERRRDRLVPATTSVTSSSRTSRAR